MSHPRYLTKSRFKLATECPTKLYYTGKKEYPNTLLEDSFLMALAEGGFQVGELAKCYFPGGHDVKTLDYDASLRETNELLKQENVIIFEPAISHESLLVRVDILVKRGKHLDLIEVKAKSFDNAEEEPFLNKNGTLKSIWKPYLYDVAFQKYVLKQAFPECSVHGYLMMADKNARCPSDGLNQKFKITKDNRGRTGVSISSSLSDADLAGKILRKVLVDDYIDMIHAGTDSKEAQPYSFRERVAIWSVLYARDEKIPPLISATCARCEFRANEKEKALGVKSGFEECWSSALGWSQEDFLSDTVLDIWNFRRKDRCIEDGAIKLDDITEDDIFPQENGKAGLSSSERQWLQVKKSQEKDLSIWLDRGGLEVEMGRWTYPLHFIDFETTMVAIPFNKGRHPYEGIAFQFSHHIVYEDGRIEHKGQYLNAERGIFPNYDFVRALKAELDQDDGTIFRYAAHENTFLNLIYRQLTEDSANVSDQESLCMFIRSITKSVSNSVDEWQGKRCMVDLLELVKRYYYDPRTKGSNSIKQVLPAILNSSDYLQEKYSKPIYGAEGGTPSHNFKDWQWIVKENGTVVDPYKLLPKLFQDVSDKDFALLSADTELKDGGAALTAYARMQFEEMSDYEREELQKALLKYCELDTLAMVMIYEGWRELLRSNL